MCERQFDEWIVLDRMKIYSPWRDDQTHSACMNNSCPVRTGISAVKIGLETKRCSTLIQLLQALRLHLFYPSFRHHSNWIYRDKIDNRLDEFEHSFASSDCNAVGI